MAPGAPEHVNPNITTAQNVELNRHLNTQYLINRGVKQTQNICRFWAVQRLLFTFLDSKMDLSSLPCIDLTEASIGRGAFCCLCLCHVTVSLTADWSQMKNVLYFTETWQRGDGERRERVAVSGEMLITGRVSVSWRDEMRRWEVRSLHETETQSSCLLYSTQNQMVRVNLKLNTHTDTHSPCV